MPLKRKSDALHALKRFCQDVGTPRELMSDCDSVFFSNDFKHYCTDHKIRQTDSIPYRQHMNGLVERGNAVKQIAKSILLDSGLPPSFWAYALVTASYLKNRTSGIHGKTPYQLCTPVSRGSPPSVSHLRVWGAPCFAYVEKDQRKDAHHNAVSQLCIFIGYDIKNNGYLVYNPATQHVLTRDTVKFDESHVGGVDVLKGTYAKTPDMLTSPSFDRPGDPKRPRPTQPDVDRLFRPSVQLTGRMNARFGRKLVSNLGQLKQQPKDYIATRITAINGRTFEQARQLRFPNSKGKLRE